MSGSHSKVNFPLEDIRQFLETSVVVTIRGVGYYWYLVGRGQGCCSTSYSIQDSLSQQRISQSKVSVMVTLLYYMMLIGKAAHV